MWGRPFVADQIINPPKSSEKIKGLIECKSKKNYNFAKK
jgi:hypothetical protein